MGRSELLILACGIACGVVHGAHAADIQPAPPQRETGRIEIGPPIQTPAPGDDRPILVPTTRKYQWIFRVPVVSIEHRRIRVTAPNMSTRWKRLDYETPALRSKRIKLWEVPEFSCKYPDLILPNECRTIWHGVYVDVPVLVSERAHVEFDAPQFGLAEQFIDVEIPRWTWTDKSFRFSLPAIAPPEAVQRLRIAFVRRRFIDRPSRATAIVARPASGGARAPGRYRRRACAPFNALTRGSPCGSFGICCARGIGLTRGFLRPLVR